MTRLVLALLLATLALGACGTAAHNTKAKSDANVAEQTIKHDKNTAKIKAIADACVKKGGGFAHEAHCAIPKGHGRAFLACAFKHKPKNLHDEGADIKDLEDCGVANR